MIKEDIVNRIHEIHGGLTRKEAETAVNAMFEEILASLAAGNEVKLCGFGTLRIVNRKGKLGTHPATGEKVAVKARNAVVFKASPILMKLLPKS